MGRELWQERAGLPDLRAVLDPSDESGVKNRYIDHLHREALGGALGLAPAQRILDLGCGIGRLSAWLAGADRAVVGVDTSMAMLSTARSRLRPNVSFVAFDGAKLPFSDGAFDRVVCVFVLQHVIDDKHLDHLAAEVARVTRPGGRLAIIEQVRRRDRVTSDYVRHRAPAGYRRAFVACGFHARTVSPVRARLGLSPLAARGWLPPTAWRAAARVDVWLARPASAFTYADWLMVFDRLEPG